MTASDSSLRRPSWTRAPSSSLSFPHAAMAAELPGRVALIRRPLADSGQRSRVSPLSIPPAAAEVKPDLSSWQPHAAAELRQRGHVAWQRLPVLPEGCIEVAHECGSWVPETQSVTIRLCRDAVDELQIGPKRSRVFIAGPGVSQTWQDHSRWRNSPCASVHFLEECFLIIQKPE